VTEQPRVRRNIHYHQGTMSDKSQDLAIDEFGQPTDAKSARKEALAAERAIASKYWGGFQIRIVATFALCVALWVAVAAVSLAHHVPLWAGLILNTIVASLFYMPMHEAVHGNISGRQEKWRGVENFVGAICAIPLGFSFAAHRSSHLRHHAYTNNPDRDPDHYTYGKLSSLVGKWFAVAVISSFLPFFAFIPALRKVLPQQVQRSLGADNDRTSGIIQLRFWILTTVALAAAFLLGVGWPALMLWYIPGRLQALWLLFVFAWFPHHPASETGRYVDTRIAVFRGSRWLIRGHDHHALHHLYPQIPHYRLRALWQEAAEDLVAKGVRAEGRALAATGPIVW